MTTQTVQHTPGPWEHQGGGRIISADHTVLIQRDDRLNRPATQSAQFEANALLIAAAPDLLAALKGMIAQHCTGACTVSNVSSHISALEAIAKAEGR